MKKADAYSKERKTRAHRSLRETEDRLGVSMTGPSPMRRFKVIKWPGGRIDAARPVRGLRFDYCPFLWDPLDWGPQHVDLTTQDLMRHCYFRWPATWVTDVDSYQQALDTGDEVLFWAEPTLGSCLSLLWLLEALVARGPDLRKAWLVASPGRTDIQIHEPEAIVQSIVERIPIREVLEPLITIRRHIASDSHEVRADLSALPPLVRGWAEVTDHLEDLLPDARGLDVIDSLILDALVEEYPRTGDWLDGLWVIGQVIGPMCDNGREHSFREDRIFERLLELSGAMPPLPTNLYCRKESLIEVWFDGDAAKSNTHFRITPLGRRVRAGKVDGFPYCRFDRWVGGRRVSNERPLRRSAASISPLDAPRAKTMGSAKRKKTT